jgi:hypothetical protein
MGIIAYLQEIDEEKDADAKPPLSLAERQKIKLRSADMRASRDKILS